MSLSYRNEVCNPFYTSIRFALFVRSFLYPLLQADKKWTNLGSGNYLALVVKESEGSSVRHHYLFWSYKEVRKNWDCRQSFYTPR